MIVILFALFISIIVLLWSAERFVSASAAAAYHLKVPSLLIGMVIIGFGTSLPEMIVSALAAHQGNIGISIGNAYGSNIANIALVLGITALLRPIAVESDVLHKQFPILLLISLVAYWQLWDGYLSLLDALVLISMFLVVMIWSFNEGTNRKKDTLAAEVKEVVNNQTMTVTHAYLWMFVGLVLLIISSRVLVWSTVSIAELLGISDLVIGLTVIALGTSMPELASSVVAVLKKEHNLALGSILGSNIFNTLVVVGIAGVIQPSAINPEVVSRDMLLMICLTVGLFIMVYKYQQPGQITRPSGLILLSVYIVYITHLVMLVLD